MLTREAAGCLIRDRRRDARAAVAAFVQAISMGDTNALAQSFPRLDETFGLAAAFRAVGRLPQVPAASRAAFLEHWQDDGDGIREAVNSDKSVLQGLRQLLPIDNGGDQVFFRGDSAGNRARRSYGLSWSKDQDVARGFARGMCRTQFQGGSVLLRCEAPAEAIFCEVPAGSDRFEEREFLVDRRRIVRVQVIERFLPLKLEERP